MVLFTEVQLSLCLLTGAVGVLLRRVLIFDEADRAVGWNTVFLLASLIPLGRAASPALFAMTVAISTSNSFILPTHQVDVLIMGPVPKLNMDVLIFLLGGVTKAKTTQSIGDWIVCRILRCAYVSPALL